jgi:hypothetical protein
MGPHDWYFVVYILCALSGGVYKACALFHEAHLPTKSEKSEAVFPPAVGMSMFLDGHIELTITKSPVHSRDCE